MSKAEPIQKCTSNQKWYIKPGMVCQLEMTCVNMHHNHICLEHVSWSLLAFIYSNTRAKKLFLRKSWQCYKELSQTITLLSIFFFILLLYLVVLMTDGAEISMFLWSFLHLPYYV